MNVDNRDFRPAAPVTGESVELAYVDQGYTGDDADADAASYGIHLMVVSLPEAKKGFVLLPKRWVVERSFGWMARFRRLARDYERLSETLEGLQNIIPGQSGRPLVGCVTSGGWADVAADDRGRPKTGRYAFSGRCGLWT